MHWFVIIISFVFLQSCSKGYGNRLTSKDLDVYFEDKKDEKNANKLGNFWKNKGLISKSKQSILLKNNQGVYQIYLIENKKLSDYPLTIQQRQALLNLQDEIDSVVFENKHHCQFIISNDKFEPLYAIDQ